MNIFKYLFPARQDEKLSLDVFSKDLIKPIDELPNFIEELYPVGKTKDQDKVYQELAIAFLFSIWHPAEVALLNNPKKNELLDYVHFNAYGIIKKYSREFNGVEFESTVKTRYQEYRAILKKQKPDDVFLKLGEAIVYHIDETHASNIGHVAALGVWIGNCMVENKKFIDKVVQKYTLS